MPRNVLELWPQIFAVAVGVLALLGAALAFSYRASSKRRAGEAGHRPEGHEGESELIGPDGYIDSFAGVIEEAGGGLPRIGWAIVVVIAVWYVVYLVLYWTPR